MKKRLLVAASLCIVVALLSGGLGVAANLPPPAPGDPSLVRVYYPDDAGRIQLFLGFEPWILETNYEEGYHIMQVTPEELRQLTAAGYRVERETTWVAPQVIESLPDDIETIPNYSCYRTVEETFAAAQALVNAHPDLATWIDVGNSWEKSVGQPDGYDMMVLKLTNSAVTGDKPKLFVMGSIHAREYTPAETATRFGEYLVNNYGLDADATWILDHHEVHLMLQANPDGRKEAEAGRSWRKNTNENYCGVTSTSRGADLNRNYVFKWGCCGGSSSYPCDATYRGSSAGSEPETQAALNYMAQIFTDQRGPNDTDAAPSDAQDIFIDLHSYSQLVMWPWGWTSTNCPNATQHQTLGRKMAYFNSYTPQKSYSLYATDGTTDDHAYGIYGVASYCIEMGTAFFQSCSTFESTIYPTNLQALLYAAKVVRAPYMTPSGPDALSLALSAGEVPAGTPVTLSGSINDTRYRQTNGTEPTQNIAAAEYYIDTPPWQGGTANAMAAADGGFNSTVEAVTATVSTTGLSNGKHLLFMRGKDANGNWGAFSAIFLTIAGPANQPPVADPQSVTTGEDAAVALTLTGSDADGDPLTFQVTAGPSHGALSGTAPDLTYTPAADYHGADTFAFVANDGKANSAPATVSLTVSPVNDAPVANAQSLSTEQDTPLAVTLSGTDVDGDALTYTVVTPPVNGSLSGAAPNLTYTPAAGYLGADSLSFVANDGQVSSAPAAISIQVTAVNHPPVADPQSVTTGEDVPVAIALTGSDPDGDPLTFQVTAGPSHGALSGAPPNVTYTPAANYNGGDGFSFKVNDGQLDSAPAAVSLTVSPVNDAPLANPQSVTAQQDTPLAITLTGSDVDGDPLTYTVVAPPAHGSLSGAAPNLTYTPAAGYSGPDSFTFLANDGAADSNVAAVSITVNASGPLLYLGSSTSGTAGGVAFADEDILIKNVGSGAWTLYIDGSDVGLANTDVDAFELQADGSLLISFDTAFTLSGFGAVDDSDILRFVPTSTGSTTAGTWQWYFDGSDVGLSTNDEDVDAFAVAPDGRLLFSTLGSAAVTGASAADEDLLAFTPAQLGATTSGTWAIYFDGSDVGLSTTSNEDINGVWVDAAGKIYLTTVGSFAVAGVSGDGSDLIVCTPGSLGSTTTCTWAMYWDGSANGFSGEDTDSVGIVY